MDFILVDEITRNKIKFSFFMLRSLHLNRLYHVRGIFKQSTHSIISLDMLPIIPIFDKIRNDASIANFNKKALIEPYNLYKYENLLATMTNFFTSLKSLWYPLYSK